MSHVIELQHIRLGSATDGRAVLASLVQAGTTALEELRSVLAARAGGDKGAALSRVRGTGPGASFGRLVDLLERDHPRQLRGPFEDSPNLSGAVWDARGELGLDLDAAFMKLRFEPGCRDLPLHSHEHSDRFIIVLEGRGYFHVSAEPVDRFTGERVQTVPVRSRDVLAFTRGVVHTFSATTEPLVLLSGHLPFLPLEEPEQYTLPGLIVRPADLPGSPDAVPAFDPAWNLLVGL